MRPERQISKGGAAASATAPAGTGHAKETGRSVQAALKPVFAQPLYMRVVAALRERVLSGGPDPVDRLPSESRLVAEFGVSRVTVRQALDVLEGEGLISRQQGRGTFVNPPHLHQQLSSPARTIVEALRETGIEPEVSLLGLDHIELSPSVAEALGVGAGPGVRLRRLYSHNGAPIALVTLYLPLSMSGVAYVLAQDVNLHETTYSVFETKMGIAIKEARHVIKTVALSKEDAADLRMRPNDVCLALERITYSAQGAPLEVMTYFYPPERMRFEITLPRNNLDAVRRVYSQEKRS